MATATRNADLKLPADLPKEPTYVGMSSTYHPSGGYEFHLVVPSAVGTVIAKSIQGLAGVRANP
jgi:hypothetical protein